MIKHVSGLFAASFLAARAIPEVGLQKARVWMQELALDPVSQYVFYAASVIFWLPETPNQALWHYHSKKTPLIPLLLLGPVLLREVVSTALVISDVLVLYACSSSQDGGTALVKSLLTLSSTFTTAFMSILVTPSVWRSANAAERQAILAKLVSHISLAMEVAVGVLMTVDAFWALTTFMFAGVQQRPPLLQVAKRMLCTRLYLQFLWTRRRKIRKLTTRLRGGEIDCSQSCMCHDKLWAGAEAKRSEVLFASR
jgi:hypothetical protein